MKYRTPGQFKDLAEFRARLRALAPSFDLDLSREDGGSADPLGRPFELDGRVIGNRFAVHPMEGWDGTRDGLPGPNTRRRWRRFGTSTAKLVWGGEAFAVQEDGRANPRQLFLNPDVDTAAGLAALRSEVLAGHRQAGADPTDLFIGLQLTHSGRYARPDGAPAPRIAVHGAALDARVEIPPDAPLLTDLELEEIGENTVRAAALAHDLGFDFVDLKCCHGYLMHELLGARSRPGRYGGSLENRARLLRAIVREIRSRCPGLVIGARVSVGDLAPYEAAPGDRAGVPVAAASARPFREGFGIDEDDPTHMDHGEPLALLGILAELDVRLVNVSLGSPYTTPHLQRPAAYPPVDGYLPPVDPLANVLDHLRAVRACRAAHPELVLVGSGYTYLMEYLPPVARHEVRAGHVDFVGLGRMMLSYPELPADVLAGRPLAHKRICRTFSDCVNATRAGAPSGCYPLDEHYRQSPRAESVRAIRSGLRRKRG